jgi:hypothetical protein
LDKNDLVKSLRCPYAPIAKWLETDTDFADRFSYLKGTDRYDWSKMVPKVTYDDWIVCLYTVDDKLYRIDMEEFVVEEVSVVEVLEYDEKNRPVDANGNTIDEDKLFTYCDNLCCGESDDMSCYIYFNHVN